MLVYKEPIKTCYSSDIFGNHNINTKKINNALINYFNKRITPDEFLKIYIFINDLNKFKEVMIKKQPGARGPNQKMLLNYGNELEELLKNLSIPQDQD